ncbi:uncharacterized protein LOC126279119 [Schistocerca gregaria]|uniref:uncharacterized protein LOC126278217 n=1 Tax=Schistocerca gregaria TaxID=7010 RepID=UPI00211F3033|nr:uncharacterized protein LOC126278217 [Schistocerca gregaria]XP_049835555.1 uncharacterized protein LOC126279119 [Schistocerca gregaria]
MVEDSASNEELIAGVDNYFAGLEETHFRDGIKALELCRNKCINLQGDYIKKYKKFQRYLIPLLLEKFRDLQHLTQFCKPSSQGLLHENSHFMRRKKSKSKCQKKAKYLVQQ